MTHIEYAQALRQIATWYAEHLDAPLPGSSIDVWAGDVNLPALIQMLGDVEKSYTTDHAWFTRRFGKMRLQFVAPRAAGGDVV